MSLIVDSVELPLSLPSDFTNIDLQDSLGALSQVDTDGLGTV